MKKKIYVLDMFPYPSGEGLHVGHPKGYIATDIYSRYKNMQGYEVIHPMGWDAFGLPAEQYAIKNKIHPKVAVEKNIANFKAQLENINFDYDWQREINTTDPKFYKWTQWIFKQLYKKGLAYESFEPINWCPSCKTGLANEDLEGNACARCDTTVEKKPLRQWNLAITKYADRLIDDLDTLVDWPEHVKTAQLNWIGRSEGSELEFKVQPLPPAAPSPQEGIERHPQNTTPSASEMKIQGLPPTPSSRGGGTQNPEDIPKYLTADIKKYENLKIKALEMRKSPTKAEDILWEALTKEFKEYHFRRQHIIDNFIVDFISLKSYLVIEVDGDIHDLQKTRDEERTKIINSYDFQVIRFSNNEVINNLEKVKIEIKKALEFSGSPLLRRGVGGEALSDEGAVSIACAEAITLGHILPDAKEVTGSTIIAYDKKKNLFLKLNNLNTNETWLPSGGKNDNETYEQCAVRELSEEAGIQKVDQIVELGVPIISYYFNINKNSNRKSLGYNYLAFVDSNQKIEASPESHEKFINQWVTYDQLYKDIKSTNGGVDHWIQALEWAKAVIGDGIGSPLLRRGVGGEAFTIFTTRADTLFGCTYTVLAPEHKLVKNLIEKGLIKNVDEVEKYINEVKNKTDIERGAEGKEKTGVRLEGVMAINPANNKQVPIYIADYVLASYGTGAIMAVPAHDERDYEFAIKYKIEIIQVIKQEGNIDVEKNLIFKNNKFSLSENFPINDDVYTGEGVLKNSGDFNNLKTQEAKVKITKYVDGKIVKKYKLREWVFARQRYWGEPFPIVYSDETKNLKLEFKEFIDKTKESAPRNDKETKEKNSILVIVKHSTEDKYICLKWKKASWGTFITGGIEGGELAEAAAVREVKEETGYQNFKSISNLGAIDSLFFHNPKDINILAHMSVIYIELENQEKDEVSKEEESKHDISWIKAEDLLVFITPESMKYVCVEILKSKHVPYIVADSELPVLLPEVESYEPTGTGESPLADIKSFTDVWGYINKDGEFESVKNISSLKEAKIKSKDINREVKLFKRETNTMPQWAGSSWYWLRYLDPHNDNFLIDKDIEKAWPQVDVYVGGDHATRHLIYARFWHKFLYDIGVVSHIEPFKRLEFLGFILAPDGSKMSKSKGNVINPDTVVAEYGSDTFRLYEMFMAPFEATAVWNTDSIKGMKRFLERVERMSVEVLPCGEDLGEAKIILHQTIKKVGEDIDNFKFNTAISQLMICLNAFEEHGVNKDGFTTFMKLLAPFAPTLCKEYLLKPWPIYDEAQLIDKNVEIALQINGKLRSTIIAPTDSDDEYIKSLIKENEAYKKYVVNNEGQSIEPKKIIIVKNKIVNVVI